jgi:Lon protease-like protein
MFPRETLSRSLDRLKIFPLPTAVLLPGAVLPLHIFEPRYRKMVADALGSDRILAMSMLESGWEQDYHGRPRVRRICGVGRIAEEERLPDGRFNIQLVGVGRAEIVEELPPEEPYRVVRARLPREEPAEPTGLPETLRHALLSLCAAVPGEGAQGLAHAAAALKDPGELADICAAALVTEASVRQKVLEELAVTRRLQLALDVVGEALLRVKTEPSDGGALN